MKYTTALFDLDGTLIYTDAEHRQIIVGQVLDIYGKTTSDELIDKFWFERNRNEIITNDFGLKPSEFWPLFEILNTVELREKYSSAYEDVWVLNELKSKGLKLGIVTMAPKRISDPEMALLNLEFDAIVNANSAYGIKPKPDPQGINACLEMLGESADKAFFVGNTVQDIQAGKAANVYDILVDREEYSFPGIQASLTIKSLEKLLEFVG